MTEVFLSRKEQIIADWIGDHPGSNGRAIANAFGEFSLQNLTEIIETLQTLNMIQWGDGNGGNLWGWFLTNRF